jgi:hypothetical protein
MRELDDPRNAVKFDRNRRRRVESQCEDAFEGSKQTIFAIKRTSCLPAAHRGERHGDEEGRSVVKCGEILEPTTRSTIRHRQRWPSCRPSVSLWNLLASPRRRRERPPCRATAQSRSRPVPRGDRQALGPSIASVRSSTTDPDISHRTHSIARALGHVRVSERRKERSRRPAMPGCGRSPASPRAEARGEWIESIDLGIRQTRGRLSRRGGARRSRLNNQQSSSVEQRMSRDGITRIFPSACPILGLPSIL